MVKKEKFIAYLKSKGFYISLLAGAAAIAVICLVCYSYMLPDKNGNLTDLNEPIAQKDASPDKVENIIQSAQNENNITNQEQKPEVPQQSQTNLLENDIYDETNEEDIEAMMEDTEVKKEPEVIKDTAQTATDETLPVMGSDKKIANGLSFNEEKGLLWPVTGDIIMKFSMDKGIYFQTLGQYKCNPAIMIGCEAGTEVYSAARSVVTDILENEETGMTVKTILDNKYEVIYGQLKDVTVSKGDSLEEGQLIGSIAEPTKYYVKEGSNLYFQVNENDESINPMLLLR